MSLYDEFKNHLESLEEIQKEDLKNKANIMQSAVNLVGLTEELLAEKQSSQEDLMLPAKKSASSYQESYEKAEQQLGEYLLTHSCPEVDLEYMQKMKLYLELLERFLLKESPNVTEENLKHHYKKLDNFKAIYQKTTGHDVGKISKWKQVRDKLNQSLARGEITTAYILG